MALLQWNERPAQVLQGGGVIGPDERLPWAQTGLMGIQHVIAMFGATVLAPILMGFDPNVAVLMSGIGTLIFFLITGGKVPSYLGSSFAFIGVVIAATAYAGKGPNANIGVALGGIIACGLVYTLVGVVVHLVGTGSAAHLQPGQPLPIEFPATTRAHASLAAFVEHLLPPASSTPVPQPAAAQQAAAGPDASHRPAADAPPLFS
jgi:hypothetical protein